MQHFTKTLLLFLSIFSSTISGSKDSSGVITVGDNYVGAISDKTAFDQKNIQKLFPNCVVKTVTSSSEGEEFPTLQIVENGDVLFVINPDMTNGSIYSIEIKSNRIKNDLGPGIGFTYSQIFKDSPSSDCTPGIEEYSGFIICRDFRSQHVYYLFSGEKNGPDYEIPPLNILNTWKIKEIIWKP
jgi:hypothetical protein